MNKKEQEQAKKYFKEGNAKAKPKQFAAAIKIVDIFGNDMMKVMGLRYE